jgi:hypothetical protein
MYRVHFIDGENSIIKYYQDRGMAERYARKIHDCLNVCVNLTKIEEILVLCLLPRENVGKKH